MTNIPLYDILIMSKGDRQMTIRELFKWAEEHDALDLPLMTLGYEEGLDLDTLHDPEDPCIYYHGFKEECVGI